MQCIKCKKDIPDGSVYCNHCGKKQAVEKRRSRKRANKQGSVYKLSGNRAKPYAAVLPAQYGEYGEVKRTVLGYFATKTEALNALNDAISKNKATTRLDMTVTQAFDEWSETAFKALSEDRVKRYRRTFKLLATLHSKRIADVRSDDVQCIVNQRIDTPSNCHEIKVLYGMLCRYAMSLDIISQDYSKFIKLPQTEKTEKRVFTRAEIERIDVHAKNGNRIAMAIMILIYSGMRISELLRLRHDNVYISERYVIGGIKSEAGKDRIIPIHSRIIDYVKRFYSDNARTLYADEYGSQIKYKTFRDDFDEFLISIDITGMTPHCTRHTHATLEQESGIPPEDMIKIMGHSDYKTTTETYIHQSVEKLRNSIEKIA